MRGDAVTLGDLAGRVAMLEVACPRCERPRGLQVERPIEQYGNMDLPELGLITAGDCPKTTAVSVSARCNADFSKLGGGALS